MNISQISTATPNFVGNLSIKNCVTGKQKLYKLSTEQDRTIRQIYNQVHHTTNQDFTGLKNYLSALYETTNDEFVKQLPPVVKSTVAPVFNRTQTYTSYIVGKSYTELCSDGFQIIHDMTK